MGNAEATRPAAGETVEIIREGSEGLEQPDAGCAGKRRSASTKVINTPHEVLLQEALIRARLSFETQSHPTNGRWEADIELHQKPIVIEVTNSPGQTRGADRRERKKADLRAAGYHVYYFSNYRARKNPDGCIAQVVAENGLTPEDEPTFLIRRNRTGQVAQNNPNWDGGAQAFACEQCGAPREAHRRNGGKAPRFCSSQCYGKWMHEHPETVNSERLQRDWTDLAELYAAGMSMRQLADHYGCSPTGIRGAMRKLGIATRPVGGYRPKGGFYNDSRP